MKNLILIAAIGKNNELGKNNDLIWKLKEDMSFFRKTTLNHPIVMGRNTFDSLPGLLPQRTHIVLTKSNLFLPEEVIRCDSIESFLDYSRGVDDDFYVIGGSSIYQQFMPLASQMVLTEMNAESNADVYFPKISKDEWQESVIFQSIETTPTYLRKVYRRKS